MIQSQMCQVFFDMFDRVRNGSSCLPTTLDILEAASAHSGIMPYLCLQHPQPDGDCRIGIFAPAWQTWLDLPSAPRSQSKVADPDRAARKSSVLHQMVQHPCGFHEIGRFSVNDHKNILIEAVSFPAQSHGTVMNIFGFAVPLSNAASQTAARPTTLRRWLDIGHGVPAQAPASTLPLAA